MQVKTYENFELKIRNTKKQLMQVFNYMDCCCKVHVGLKLSLFIGAKCYISEAVRATLNADVIQLRASSS